MPRRTHIPDNKCMNIKKLWNAEIGGIREYAHRTIGVDFGGQPRVGALPNNWVGGKIFFPQKKLGEKCWKYLN